MTQNMSRKSSKIVVSSADFVEIDMGNVDLPYLKSVDLVKLSPKQFGLERWKPNIHLSDSWMRKIYANDYLNDSDSSIESEPEELNPYQKKVLFEYLTQLYAQERTFQMRKPRNLSPIKDCLLELLDKSSDEDSDSELKGSETKTQSSKSQESTTTRHVLDKIELCNKHKYHSEEGIVTIALDKMKNLSPEDETRCQNLLQDVEFMTILNDQVRDYLKNSKD